MPYWMKKPTLMPSGFYEGAKHSITRRPASGRRLTEAVAEQSVDEDWGGWRSLSGVAALREIRPGVHIRMLRIVKFLYDSNPLAKRIVEYTKNFVIGEGVFYETNHEGVKEVLDAFWFDDVNKWPLRQHDRMIELSLYGEAIWPVTVNPKNGHVRLGFVDPLEVARIVVNEDNCLIPEYVRLSKPLQKRQELKIIRRDEDPKSPTYNYLTGETFFFAINRVSNMTRGASDLLPLIDWIDAYDQFLFTRLERQILINNFVWDVELEGADETEIEAFMKRVAPPTPGTVRAHNERVKWQVVNPTLQASDAMDEAKLLRSHILSGAGYPPHWFADPEGTRAVAYEMGTPTEKNLVARQKFVRSMLESVFEFVIDQAIIHGRLPRNVDRKFNLVFPEVNLRDLERLSRTLKATVESLEKASDREWVNPEDIKKIIKSIIIQYGVELK